MRKFSSRRRRHRWLWSHSFGALFKGSKFWSCWLFVISSYSCIYLLRETLCFPRPQPMVSVASFAGSSHCCCMTAVVYNYWGTLCRPMEAPHVFLHHLSFLNAHANPPIWLGKCRLWVHYHCWVDDHTCTFNHQLIILELFSSSRVKIILLG
jgi:hypothetical protein